MEQVAYKVTGETCPVGKLERILLAVDQSEYSEGATREALRFASRCSSEMDLSLTIDTNPEYETIGASVFEKEEEEASAYLETLRLRAERAGITTRAVLHESGDAADSIVQDALEKKADMIVIGRRGYKGLVKALMGEVAAKVIAHAPCKVLVVPRAAEIGYRNILVATDGSVHATAAVNEAIAIAKHCGSRIIAVSAMHDETRSEEASHNATSVLETARREGVEAEALTPVGKPAKAIIETAGGRAVDLIVMGTYGKTGLKKILMGSTTEKVIGSAGCAVMVVKA